MIDRFEEFTGNIALAYKYIIKIKTAETQKYGLKASHVLSLVLLGKYEDGLTAVELCELCQEDKAGISKTLSDLKRQELIDIESDGIKKYRSKYFITEKGRAVYDELEKAIREVVDKCSLGISDEERKNFYNNLAIIVSNLKDYYENIENK